MKAKVAILFLFLLVSQLSIAQDAKWKTREGIQLQGQWRFKVTYPFAFTFGRNRDFEINKIEAVNFQKTTSKYYHLGYSPPNDTNFHLRTETFLLYKLGLGAEYNITNRISAEGCIKTWKFRKDWDSNKVSQKGTFSHLSFPFSIKYEFFRRKYLSAKIGLGYELFIETYKNMPEIDVRVTKWDFFLPIETYTKFNAKNNTEVYSGFSVDLILGIRLTKRINLDYVFRAGGYSNYHQFGIGYLLNRE